jgi:DNA-binding NarL/FixJ family response regulator
MTRILLADDHPVVRLGLRDLLVEEFPGAEIGEARSVPELLAAAREHEWDILVLDVSLAGANGMPVARFAICAPTCRSWC